MPMLDVVLYNGTVITQANPALAQAVGVRDGRIAHVGTTADLLSLAGAHTTCDASPGSTSW